MKALIGNFDARVDAKRRVALACGIREQISSGDGENFVLVPDPDPAEGRDRYLWMFPDVYFRRLASSMKRSGLTPEQQQGFDRWLAIAQIVKPDGQGRVVLPESSIKYAVVGEEIKLSCSGNHIEIWPRDKWEAQYETEATLPRSVFDLATDELAAE
jgi:division/cell wall cluster transcriptional repressor MraZ